MKGFSMTWLRRVVALWLLLCSTPTSGWASSKGPVSASFVPSTLTGTGSRNVVLRIHSTAPLPGIALELNLPEGITLEAGERSKMLDAMNEDTIHEIELKVHVGTIAPGEVIANARVVSTDTQSLMSSAAVLQVNPVRIVDVDQRKTLSDGTRIRVREVKSQ